MLNQHTIIGTLGRDPEIRSMNNGDKVANLSVATSESWKDKSSGERKERTEWHRVTTFNQGTIKYIEMACRKGVKVAVVGEVRTRKYQDSDGNDRYATETVIPNFGGQFKVLSSRKDAKEESGDSGDSGGYNEPDDLDDEIPF